KSKNSEIKAFAVEPVTSAVISGEGPGKHRIQGIGAGFIPGNLDTSIIDDVVTVTDEESFEWGRKLAKEEGIMAGISSGANVCAAAKIAARPEFAGKIVVTVLPSLGERYLSTPLFEGATE
ncbi:MAG: pyridoxal-phosphate dependent enzyme, partial [Planctomycetaceae bacterium]|nr:pyridoxal-phosphate dependent enzyme [Planctomycetaceae bacterium]